MSAFDDMVSELVAMRFPRDKAVEQVRRQYPHLIPESIDASDLDDEAREKEVEAEGDRLMLALGFEVVRLSQARRSKIAPGLPDRRYYRRPRVIRRDGAHQLIAAIKLWWEAKAEWGVQSPDQKDFQEEVEACGETYVLGTHEDLFAWLEAQGIARKEADGTITPLHQPIVSGAGSGAPALPDVDRPEEDPDRTARARSGALGAKQVSRRDRRA